MSRVTRPAGEADAATEGRSIAPQPLGRVDHAAEARAGPAVRLDDLAAVAQVARLELRAVGGDIAERIGLVRHHGEEQLHAGLLDIDR